MPHYYTISSGYHDLRDYGLHGAIDIPAPAVPAVAIGAGVVIFVGWTGSAGRSVYLELEGGYRAHYCHLSEFNVAVGQVVAAGDTIGHVGGSGHGADSYYGSHLHLNLFSATQPATGPSHWVPWVGMWAVNPELYLGREDEDMAMTDEQWKLLQDTHHHVHVLIPQLVMRLEQNNKNRYAQLQKDIAAIAEGADGVHSHTAG